MAIKLANVLATGDLPFVESLPSGPETPEKETQPLLGIKGRAFWGFGTSAHTPVLFGGENLSPGDQRPLPYDQTCFAGARGRSRCSLYHPRSATSREVRGP
jgi:hypothetical protein